MCHNVLTIYTICKTGNKTIRFFQFYGICGVHNQDWNLSLVWEGQARQGDQISAVDSSSISRYVQTRLDQRHYVKKKVHFSQLSGLCGVHNQDGNQSLVRKGQTR